MADPHQAQLILAARTCTMAELIDESKRYATADPTILDMIEGDLDAHALSTKEMRLVDAKWAADQHPNLPQEQSWKTLSERPVKLDKGGRKRTPSLIILAALFIRGCYESLTDANMRDRLIDSTAFHVLLDDYQMDSICPTVLVRHLNTLTDATVNRIWDTQITCCRDQKLDDFATFMADSTSVRANSEWPKDSRVILKLLRRAINTLTDFEKKGWCKVRWYNMKKWLKQIHVLAREIDFTCGKCNGAKKRRKLYRKLVILADQLSDRLGEEWDRIEGDVNAIHLCPSQAKLRWQATEALVTTLTNAVQLIPYVYVRTQVNSAEKREEHEQILSINDIEAEIIRKGGREPNFGYKPQLAASRQGFITGAIVTVGNVSDARSLIPLLDESIRRCGVTPRLGTVDDGYSSAENWRQAVEKRGLDTMSMNGATGKLVINAISPELWEREDYQDGRRLRGLMESPIFVLKQMNGLDRMRRTGVAAVRREITEKVIAYNAVRAVQLRKRATAAARGKQVPTADPERLRLSA
jgi:IS5 family transposase